MSLNYKTASDIRLARDGCNDACTRLFERFRPFLKNWAKSINVGPEFSRSDLVQDAWLRVVKGIKQFKGADEPDDEVAIRMFYGWLRKTAFNAMFNCIKRHSKPIDGQIIPIENLGALSGSMSSPSSQVRGIEQSERVRDAIDHLEDQTNQQILRMVFWDGVSLMVIANILEMDYSKVRRKFHASLALIAKELNLQDIN